MKHTLFFILAITCYVNVLCQTNTVDESVYKKDRAERDRKLLLEAKEKSELIFEGIVISCNEFYNKSKSTIYTKYEVKIKNFLKGTSSDSLIEVISYMDFGDAILPIDMYPEPRKNLPAGDKIIFYVVTNKWELSENEDINSKKYVVYKDVQIKILQESSYNLPIAQFKSYTFMNRSELYEALGFFQLSLQTEKVLEARKPNEKELNDFFKP